MTFGVVKVISRAFLSRPAFELTTCVAFHIVCVPRAKSAKFCPPAATVPSGNELEKRAHVTAGRPAIEGQIRAALDATPPRVPVLLGGCGSGRTQLLRGVAEAFGRSQTQYLDIERAASTPEGFYAAVTRRSPYSVDGTLSDPVRTPRGAFDALVAFLQTARRSDGEAAVFLIDEILELRMFESFPGLRSIVKETIDTISTSRNRFVVSTRYIRRARRLLRDGPDRFEVIFVPPLSVVEVSKALAEQGLGRDAAERIDLARLIQALTDGRPRYVRALAEAVATMGGASSGDPVSGLASALAVDAHLYLICRFSYELRLHRARGYGALKAILQVLANEEPLTLTEIAHRLGRTPGSTKDYLTWLEDVDLVRVNQKRYAYADPLLRLWVRLHATPGLPSQAELSREVQEYAVSRLSFMEPAPAIESVPSAVAGQADTPDPEERTWSIIEID